MGVGYSKLFEKKILETQKMLFRQTVTENRCEILL